MAFTRQYGAQGDPFPRRIMRAGRLVTPMHQAPRGRKSRAALARLRVMRTQHAAGDPFRFRMPKFVRKLSLKKVVSGVGKLAKVALPLAATAFGGPLGGIAASFLGGGSPREGAGGAPESPAPELTYTPPTTGTLGEASRQYDEPEPEEDEYDEDEDTDDFDDYDEG